MSNRLLLNNRLRATFELELTGEMFSDDTHRETLALLNNHLQEELQMLLLNLLGGNQMNAEASRLAGNLLTANMTSDTFQLELLNSTF